MDLKEVSLGLIHRHPWETGRFAFFLDLLKRKAPFSAARQISILDVGAGDGWFLGSLVQKIGPQANGVCWDSAYEEVQPSVTSAERVEYCTDQPKQSFGLIVMLDVLEHVEDDVGFLSSVVRQNLNADGWILLSCPAWQQLYSQHDRFLGHVRRYSPSRLKDLAKSAGLQVIQDGSLFQSLVPLRYIQVLKEKFFEAENSKKPKALGDWRGGRLTTGLLHHMLLTDAKVSNLVGQLGIPTAGLSTWVLCKKS